MQADWRATMKIDEAIQALRKATNKWHPCDEKTKALEIILSELAKYREAEQLRQRSEKRGGEDDLT